MKSIFDKFGKNIGTLIIAIVFIAFAIIPLFISSAYILQIFILIFLFAAAAGSWNIVGGYAGQISLGHVAFFGIGAYTTMLLYLRFGISPWLGLILAGILAAVIGGLISYPCFRLRGPFFTLATLAFAEVLRLLAIWARPVTGGAVGLTVLYQPSFGNMIFPGKMAYYYIGFVLMLIVFAVSVWIGRSKFGYYLTALKENHNAAEALGVHTSRYKLYAMAISAFLTAICGAFYAQVLLYIEPASVFISSLSNQFAMIAVIGGVGTAFGPILGSIIMTPLNEILRSSFSGAFQGMNFVIFGLLIILVVTYMPNGLVGFCKKIEAKFLAGRRKKDVRS